MEIMPIDHGWEAHGWRTKNHTHLATAKIVACRVRLRGKRANIELSRLLACERAGVFAQLPGSAVAARRGRALAGGGDPPGGLPDARAGAGRICHAGAGAAGLCRADRGATGRAAVQTPRADFA